MTLICDCTEQAEQDIQPNNFTEYLLNTSSVDGIITPRVPSNLTYGFENCSINDILENAFIVANERFYQLAKQINAIYENKQNDVNVLLNKGILNNGQIRDNIDAETTILNEALADMNTTFGLYESSHNKFVDQLQWDISNVTTGKVNVDTLNQIQQSYQQIISKNKKKISNLWILAQNQLKVAFVQADSAAVLLSDNSDTPVMQKQAIASVVETIKQLERDVELDFQNAENHITHIQHGAEQEIVNVYQTICVYLTK